MVKIEEWRVGVCYFHHHNCCIGYILKSYSFVSMFGEGVFSISLGWVWWFQWGFLLLSGKSRIESLGWRKMLMQRFFFCKLDTFWSPKCSYIITGSGLLLDQCIMNQFFACTMTFKHVGSYVQWLCIDVVLMVVHWNCTLYWGFLCWFEWIFTGYK